MLWYSGSSRQRDCGRIQARLDHLSNSAQFSAALSSKTHQSVARTDSPLLPMVILIHILTVVAVTLPPALGVLLTHFSTRYSANTRTREGKKPTKISTISSLLECHALSLAFLAFSDEKRVACHTLFVPVRLDVDVVRRKMTVVHSRAFLSLPETSSRNPPEGPRSHRRCRSVRRLLVHCGRV